jgi:GNAT superfamily N-acetyltransferase
MNRIGRQRRPITAKRGAVSIHPVTPERWPDLERLFGERGACAGCWCMYWRLPRRELDRQKGEGNRRALRRLVRDGPAPGLIAYVAGEPVAWCAVGPRDGYPTLNRSRVLKPVDARPVWSVVCFFVQRGARGRGLTPALLRAAAAFARRNGADLLEGYPVDPGGRPYPPTFAYTGLLSAFRRAGFREAARRSPTRPIMRRRL